MAEAGKDLRVIGHQWSARSHEIKDLLTRNHVRYVWMDIDTDPQARELLAAAGLHEDAQEETPVVITASDEVLVAPTDAELAAAIGLQIRPQQKFYDLIIVGAGPAGLAAAVYGASEGLRTMVVDRWTGGGQAAQSSRIENYLGFPRGVSGADLAVRARSQAARFGAEMVATQEVCELRGSGSARIVCMTQGEELTSHAVILAMGVTYRRLEAPGLAELSGRGVYYGSAISEAQAVRGQNVYIVGGANSAGQASLYFSRYAARVTILVRADRLDKDMSHYLVKRIEATANIEPRLRCEVVGAAGSGHLESITIADRASGREVVEPARFLFIFIGTTPHTEWLGPSVALDDNGYILSGDELLRNGARLPWSLDRRTFPLETSLPGVFAAGDARLSSMKRVSSAVGEGAMAVHFVHEYLRSGSRV